MNPAASDGYFEISCERMSAAPSMTQVLERQEYFFLLQFLAAGRADEKTRADSEVCLQAKLPKKHEERELRRGRCYPTAHCYSNRMRMRKLDEVFLKRLSANICYHQRVHQTDRLYW